MTAPPPRKVKLCPDCNADNDDGAKWCWACQADLASAREVIFAELVAEAGPSSRPKGDWIGIGAISVVGLIMVGATCTQSLGMGIMLALVVIVAIVALLLARPSLRKSLDSPPLAPKLAAGGNYFAESAESPPVGILLPQVTPASAVVKQVFVTLGVVALVMFAGFIALFLVCVGLIFVETSRTPRVW